MITIYSIIPYGIFLIELYIIELFFTPQMNIKNVKSWSNTMCLHMAILLGHEFSLCRAVLNSFPYMLTMIVNMTSVMSR